MCFCSSSLTSNPDRNCEIAIIVAQGRDMGILEHTWEQLIRQAHPFVIYWHP